MINLKKTLKHATIGVIYFFCTGTASAGYIDYVDPFIGSDDTRWVYFSPASLPEGLVSSGPVTSGLGGYAGGGNKIGYEYASKTISGIAGIKEYQLSSLLILPTCGIKKEFKTKIKDGSEVAKPGYYGVNLIDKNSQINIEVVPTKRTVLLKTSFNDCKSPTIMINHTSAIGEGGVGGEHKSRGYAKIISANEVEGWTEIEPPYLKKKVRIFFYIKSDNPIKFEIGRNIVMSFSDPLNLLKIGFSFTSMKSAKENYLAESSRASFDEVKLEAARAWEGELSKVRVKGDHNDMVKFYTALWNVLRSKSITDDVDGSYVNYRGLISRLENKSTHIYNSDSLWGGHWSVNQVWTLLYPQLAQSYARGLLKVYEDAGWMPDGWAINTPAPGMPTNTSTIFLTSLITKGLIDKTDNLMGAINKNNKSIEKRPYGFDKEGMSDFVSKGYIPIQTGVYGAASSTIERSFDDFCANTSIKILTGKYDEYFSRSSLNYRKLLNTSNKWFLPMLDDGKFIDKFNPESSAYFAEGNSYQYTFYPSHDLDFVMNAIGRQNFEKRLENAIRDSSIHNYTAESNTGGYSGLNYNPGNQVSMHMPWLFHSLNRPEKSWYYVNDVLDRFYGLTPYNGYGVKQDEDQGQLSAWYVLSSIGIFDIKGNCDIDNRYYLIPPLFKEVSFNIDGRSIDIGNATTRVGNLFCTSFNGTKQEAYISFDELKNGGKLKFTDDCN